MYIYNLKKNVSDISIGLVYIVLYYINMNTADAHKAPYVFFVYNIFDDPYKVDSILLNKL